MNYFGGKFRLSPYKDNIVLISEYNAPDDFNCIWQFDHFLSIRSNNGCEKTIEKIFVHRDHNNKKYIFHETNNIDKIESYQLSMDFNTL